MKMTLLFMTFYFYIGWNNCNTFKLKSELMNELYDYFLFIIKALLHKIICNINIIPSYHISCLKNRLLINYA